jgi:hypothetical protein
VGAGVKALAALLPLPPAVVVLVGIRGFGFPLFFFLTPFM